MEMKVRSLISCANFIGRQGIHRKASLIACKAHFASRMCLDFYSITGLTMAFEPVDWALTTVDVINALSEGDIESAVGDFITWCHPIRE